MTISPDKTLVLAIGCILLAATSPGFQGAQNVDAGGAADTAPRTANELQALVAPIALYPDPLVAQVLAAATFPDQVAIASYWLGENRMLGSGVAQAVNKQSWDASVKALTQFPSVLNNMAKNLNWTSAVGEAYHNQPSEVMAAIQTLRAQAKAAGNLNSGPQIKVTQQSPQVITIEPANPQVVYVPQYDPAAIYGVPYAVPDYTAAYAAGALMGFGAGVAVGCCGWGSWNANWAGGAVIYNHNNFYGNPAWHGAYYNGGYHEGYGYHNAYNRIDSNYRGYASRSEDWNHPVSREVDGDRWAGSNSWSRADSGLGRWNAFNGAGDRLGGWQSRAESFRGWGSMRDGGFTGGRFAGGGFGGGGFRGGFRR